MRGIRARNLRAICSCGASWAPLARWSPHWADWMRWCSRAGSANTGAPFERLSESLSYHRLGLDTQASMDPAGDRDISVSDSQVRVLVISAREDLTILRHVMRVLDWTCPRSRPSPDVSVAANDLVGCPSDTVLSTGVDSPVSAASSDRRLSDVRAT